MDILVNHFILITFNGKFSEESDLIWFPFLKDNFLVNKIDSDGSNASRSTVIKLFQSSN